MILNFASVVATSLTTRCFVVKLSNFADSKGKKGKAEHLYSALHGIQTTFKRSGMDHTVSPADGASTD